MYTNLKRVWNLWNIITMVEQLHSWCSKSVLMATTWIVVQNISTSWRYHCCASLLHYALHHIILTTHYSKNTGIILIILVKKWLFRCSWKLCFRFLLCFWNNGGFWRAWVCPCFPKPLLQKPLVLKLQTTGSLQRPKMSWICWNL